MPQRVRSAIVLAGGKSSRMGQDKALLELDGVTLLSRMVTRLRPLADEVAVIVDTPGKYALSGCRVIGDVFPDTGPVGGILTGLLAMGSGWHFVVACDLPFVRPELMHLLVEHAAAGDNATVPYLADRAEPLCALYHHTAVPFLKAFLETGQRAAHKALDTMRTRRIDESALREVDPTLASFYNVNTPEDYRRLKHTPDSVEIKFKS